MPRFRTPILAALALVAAPMILAAPHAAAEVAGSTSAVNTDDKGVALRGYDPVAYFESGKPTQGQPALFAEHEGSRYLFATEAHRAAFVANPDKYAPQFGGFCAVGTSFGEKVDADPETGQVVGGKLYVNYSKKVQARFNQDAAGTIARAEQNWPSVKAKAAE